MEKLITAYEKIELFLNEIRKPNIFFILHSFFTFLFKWERNKAKHRSGKKKKKTEEPGMSYGSFFHKKV
jgi:hypothetical protein